MRHNDEDFSRKLRAALAERAAEHAQGAIDSHTFTDRITAEVREDHVGGTRRHRSRMAARRGALIGGACLAAACTGVGVVAASPTVRHTLEQVGVIPNNTSETQMSASGIPLAVRPVPPFQVFYPTSVPTSMPIRGIGQFPDGGLLFSAGCPTPEGGCVDDAGHPIERSFASATGSELLPSAVLPFARSSVDVLWMGFHAAPPGQESIQLVEWSATGPSPNNGSNQPVIPAVNPGDSTLTITRGGTRIEINTNLGSIVASQVAAALQPLAGEQARR